MRGRPIDSVSSFLRLDQAPRVVAHRGFSGRAPENTLASFRAALELGVDMIELDVQLSRDGVPVVLHDAELSTTTNGRGAVGETGLEELRRLDAGGWFGEEFSGEGIPTLDEVLDLCRGRVLLNVEIKGGGEIRRVVAAVVRSLREQSMEGEVLLSSFEPRALIEARRLAPEIATASLYNDELHEGRGPLEVMAEVGSRAFYCSVAQVGRRIVAACHSAGRPVGVYTVNERSRMKQLLALGIDVVFTDRPDLLLELLGRRTAAE